MISLQFLKNKISQFISYVNTQTTPLSSKQLEAIMLRKQDLEMYECLQTIFIQQCNGDDIDNYVIDIIKNVSQCHSHQLKRLIHQFWPTINPFYPNGQIKPFMILICNSLQQDLQSANEFIVSSALRCISNLQASEVVKHLVQAIESTLSHDKAEVRYYSVICCSIWSDLIDKEKVLARIPSEQNLEVLKKLIIFIRENYDINDYIQILLQKSEQLQQNKLIPELLYSYYQLTQQNQQQLLQHLNQITQWSPQDLYELAIKIEESEIDELNSIKINSLLLSLQSANNQMIPIVFNKLRNSSFKNLKESIQIVSSVLQLLQQNIQNKEVIQSVFDSKILQKLALLDKNQENKIVFMLANSRLIEESDSDVVLKLIQTIFEIIQQNQSEISETFLNQILQIFKKCQNNQNWVEIIKIVIQMIKKQNLEARIQILINLLVLIENPYIKKIAYDFTLIQLTEVQIDQSVANGLMCQIEQDLLQLEQLEFQQQNYIVFQTYLQVSRLVAYQNADKHQIQTVLMTAAKYFNQIQQKLSIQQQNDSLNIIKSIYIFITENKKTLQYKLIKKSENQVQKQQIVQQQSQFIPQFSLFNQNQVNMKQNQQNNQQQKQQQEKQSHTRTLINLNQTINNNPTLLSTVYQLSADSDQVFAECLIKRTENVLYFHFTIKNRSDKLIENLRLNLLSQSCLCSCQQQNIAILPHQSEEIRFSAQILDFCQITIFGQLEVKFKNQNQISMRLQPILIEMSSFLLENQITKQEFLNLWRNKDYIEQNFIQKSFDVNKIKELHLSLIGKINFDCEQIQLLSVKNVSDDIGLIYLNSNGRIKVKSQNQKFAESLIQLMKN